MRLFFSIFVLTICLIVSTKAQNITGPTSDVQSSFPKYMPNVMPPSPDAFSFTRYGNLPIGISTGTAQFNIPVYTISAGTLKHAISINYSSNGVKVDEMATRVGINWNLRAGGQITRIVMDKPDDAPGVTRTFYNGIVEVDSTAHTFYNYVRQGANAAPPDFQPDEYAYSVDGYSGKFIQRENGEYMHFGASAVKIEKNSSGFILTGTEGNRYYFYGTESARNYSYPEQASLEWVPNALTTAWYLTKIVSPANDSIVFHYSAVYTPLNSFDLPEYINGISQSLGTGTYTDIGLGYFLNPGEYNLGTTGAIDVSLPAIDNSRSAPGLMTAIQLSTNTAQCLTAIDFPLGSIHFKYSGRQDVSVESKLDSIKVVRLSDSRLIKAFKLNYTYSYAEESDYDSNIEGIGNFTEDHPELRKRLFLTSVEDISSDLSSSHDYLFEYDDINALPPRLSFSQDKYGFFNGKVNQRFYPNDTWFEKFLAYRSLGGNRDFHFGSAKKGILTKITYPTGGFSKFEYEPHKTNTFAGDYAFTRKIDSFYSFFDTSSYVGQTIYSDTFYHNSNVRTLILKGFCDWASVPVNLTHHGIDTALEGVYHITWSLVNVNTNSCVSVCDYTANPGDTFMYSNFFSELLPEGYYRIEAVANRPHLRAKFLAERRWREPNRSDTSGIAGVRVKSVTDYSINNQPTNRREFLYCNWGSPDSSSGDGLVYDDLNTDQVSVTREIAANYMSGYNNIHSNSVFGNYISDNNTVFYRKVIELNTSMSDTTKNNGGTEYEFNYVRKQKAVPITFQWHNTVFYPAPLIPPGAPYMNNDFLTGSIKSSKLFTYTTKHGSRNILQETSNFYKWDTLAIDTFTVSKEVIKRSEGRGANWNYFYDFDIFRYWRYYGFLKLDSTIQKNFSGLDALINKTSYYYNYNNYKPSLEVHQTSTVANKYVYYTYPGGVTSSQNDYADYSGMVLKNIVDVPIRVYVEKNSQTKLQQSYFDQYSVGGNTFYQLANVKSQLNTNLQETELTVEQYNSQGNIVQYKGRDGITNTIIWGYGDVYPVAKVQGASYSSCMAVLDNSIINNPSSDHALRTELHKLRTLLSGTVFASTLTYSPLIGVTSETDINNRTRYYEYDSYNRLQLIRDQDSNIVKRICYNFKGEQTECAETHTFPATPCNDCTGYDKLCIDGVCLTSTKKILIASTQVGINNWSCTYAYEFVTSEGAVLGPEFTLTNQFACLIFL